MEPVSSTSSWETLKQLLHEDAVGHLEDYLDQLHSAEMLRAISRLSHDDRTLLFSLLQPEEAADIIEDVPDAQAVEVLEDLPPNQAAAILEEMRSDHQVDLLGQLDEADSQAILEEFNAEEAQEIRQLLTYPSNTAGGLMMTEYLAYSDQLIVREVLDDLREQGESYSDYDVQYAYVVTQNNILTGVLRLRDLLLSRKDKLITEIMIPQPVSVKVNDSLENMHVFFQEHSYLGVPVVESEGQLVGVVRRSLVREAMEQQANGMFLKASGIVGGEELRSMPLMVRSTRRLSWLSINIILNIIAASVIAFYQDTLEKAITLAVFLPIISDMSGCSGNQAVAVSMRELTMGLIRPLELTLVLWKEVIVGLVNGTVLGLLLGAAALLWKGNPYLGLVVGTSLAINTLIAVAIGGCVPLVLSSMKKDPALASGPILTTVTDMCGFFLVLSLASFFLPHLT